jgi:sialic acid synthase SpsE
MEYVYHKKEDGSIAGAYPLKDTETNKIVGGAAVAHLGVPVGVVIIEHYCQPRPYIEEDSEKPLDFERFDELITNIAKIEGSKGSSDDKKTRKRRKGKK